MNKLIPDIKIPIINNDVISIKKLSEEFNNKKIVVFGVPGAFTPTCSEKHFPSFIKCYQEIINKKIEAIYCLSVNDQHVLRKWFQKCGCELQGLNDKIWIFANIYREKIATGKKS